MSTTLTSLHPQIGQFQLDDDKITAFVNHLLPVVERADFSLSLVLVDDKEMQSLNHRYRGKNVPTNVLSFPFEDGDIPDLAELPLQELGDIIISLDTAKREAKEYDVNFSRRLCWLIIHGLLHLCGMDHERSPQEAKEMAAREQMLLKHYQQKLCKE